MYSYCIEKSEIQKKTKKRSADKNGSHFENFWGCLQVFVLWGLAGMTQSLTRKVLHGCPRGLRPPALKLLCTQSSRGKIGRKPGKHQSDKKRCQDLCWKVHDPAQSFAFPSCTMHYVTNTFLLVSSSARSKQLLCFVQGQG